QRAAWSAILCWDATRIRWPISTSSWKRTASPLPGASATSWADTWFSTRRSAPPRSREAPLRMAPAFREWISPRRAASATAGRERSRRRGALPGVTPAGIDEDLGRRDFSVNAMAVALAPSAWGRLHDPHGGTEDVLARRLRVLHPLSLVEDSTRIWRGARYAA